MEPHVTDTTPAHPPPGDPILLKQATFAGELTLSSLPDDPDTLKRMILELLVTLHQRDRDLDAVRHRLDLLLRRLYGPRGERFHPNQPLLFPDADVNVASPAADVSATPTEQATEPVANGKQRRRGKPHGRGVLPDKLPRRPLHHELTESERLCVCGHARSDIGVDVSEQLDWQPGSYFVWQHMVHKYACPYCTGKMPAAEMAAATETASPVETTMTEEPETTTTTAAATGPASAPTSNPAAIGPAVIAAVKPAMPIAKGLPGPGLLAHVIVSKYFDHLPLYRQENIHQRQGVFISRSTTCDWMAACAALLRPLYDMMVSLVMQSVWLHTDDTPVKNQGHAPGATPTGRFWVYLGDRVHPYNVFDFTVNRQRDGPQTFLDEFHGYLHADAFSGYDALYLPSPCAGAAPIIEVACNAHARRKFYEARTSDAARAHQALAYYAQLYEIERRAKELHADDEVRRHMRQDLAVPILDKFHAWLKEQRVQVVPKSPMAGAIGYALNQWTALIRYTEAGFLSIDNNVAEREMKRIAIGRKNWLFVGSNNGGRTAAVLFSFTSTCHRLSIDPWAYLHDVLTRLPRTPAQQLGDLLPDRWQAHLEASPAAPAAAP